MGSEFPDAGWMAVDQHLYRGEIILALDAAREQFGPSRRRAMHALQQRLTYLAEYRPESFRVPLNLYGQDLTTS